MPEASLVIKATDRYSSTLKTLSGITRSFNKDVDGLEAELAELAKQKAPLTSALKEARTALTEAQEQFSETGDAAAAFALAS